VYVPSPKESIAPAVLARAGYDGVVGRNVSENILESLGASERPELALRRWTRLKFKKWFSALARVQ